MEISNLEFSDKFLLTAMLTQFRSNDVTKKQYGNGAKYYEGNISVLCINNALYCIDK